MSQNESKDAKQMESLKYLSTSRWNGGKRTNQSKRQKSFGKWLKIIFSLHLQRERECRHTFSTVNTTWFFSNPSSCQPNVFHFRLNCSSSRQSTLSLEGKTSNYSFNRACIYNQTQLVRWQPQKIRRLKPFFFSFFFAFPPSPAVPFRPKAFYF